MKVLQLCHRVPFPANDGGNIAMINLAEALISQGVELKMLTLNTVKHFSPVNELSGEIRSKYRLEAVPIDTGIRIRKAVANLFSSGSYNVSRFYSNEFDVRLQNILEGGDYDFVILESVFMANYISTIRNSSKAKIILRAHNVEYVIWQRLAKNEKQPLKRWYLNFLAKRLHEFERNTLHEVDAVLSITVDDKQTFLETGCKCPVHVTPVGINLLEYQSQVNPDAPLCLFHLGSMDWRPNLEGINWFLDECWPLLHSKYPELQLYLAGRGFPKHLIDRGDANVHCEGEILNAFEFMKGKQLMIVPLKSGGGMRVKIIQGMALGKTIISTSIGAEGIQYTDGKNILIADTPDAFLLQVERCMKQLDFCLNVGEEARKLVAENYSNEVIGKQVVDFLNSL